MKIKLLRDITGENLVKELEKKYGSITKLEALYQNNMDDLKLYTDLEDWKYYSNNPDEVVKDGKTIVSDELDMGELELKLLNCIKSNNPQSVNELAEMVDSDIRVIFPKVYQLVDQGVIELTPGPKKTLMPVFTYDHAEIEE